MFCRHCSVFLYAILTSCINSAWCSTPVSIMTNETDNLALIAFKDGITQDPLGILSSWNNSFHFCQWRGVLCGSRHPQRVMALNLQSSGLVGFLSPYIGNFTFATKIELQNNSFHGEIPPEVGRLFELQVLDLHANTFRGQIPSNLTHCSNLIYLDLMENEIQGRIPDELHSLSKLNFLGLSANNLTGSLPASLGNLSYLAFLSLARNYFEGSIPESLGQIQNISFLQLGVNELSGTIPSTIYNLSALSYFSVLQNQIEGSIPSDIAAHTLPAITMLILAKNRFSGPIPVSLSNSTKLEYIALSFNEFTGPVPKDLGRLQNLYHIDMNYNRLGTEGDDDLDFIDSLTNCTHLESMNFFANNLRGPMVNSIANLSKGITNLELGENQIHGSIPSEIVNFDKLERLYMASNYFSGVLPADIGKLYRLRVLTFGWNKLSGEIPSSLGNLSLLLYLDLEGNSFNGEVPPDISLCHSLLGIKLSYNNLTGSIPKELMGLSSLSEIFNISHNSFTGSVPLEVGNLINLEMLDASSNLLSGEIPSTLGSCVKLTLLSLEGNLFLGGIPQSLETLRGLDYIDLSHNKLSGQIPTYLGQFTSLTYLNLSFNELSGEVPTVGVFQNVTAVSVLGNYNLCGGVPELKLPKCQSSSSERKRKHLGVEVVAPLVAAILCMILLACLLIAYHYKRKATKNLSDTESFSEQFFRISYSNLHRATDGFSNSNIIGIGSYGTVYKAVLEPSGMLVAVKVLNLHQRGASKSFMSECRALKKIRHRNLLKVFSVCSSVDFQGNDFKALVFEFMSKGNLEKWLHPEEDESKILNFLQRLDIAIGVASAIEYLHSHCQATIVHCDLKPSNVLLDEEMTAHVGDFGLANVISVFTGTTSTESNQTSNAALRGSIGYIAPEYGMNGSVSTEGDVYSYGILLLEMFTGQRPTDEMFKDDQTLQKFVKMSLPECVVDVMDPILLLEGDGRNEKECCISILRVGLTCSMESPRDRMEMGEVVKELCSIRETYLGNRGLAERRENWCIRGKAHLGSSP